jgi:transketolase
VAERYALDNLIVVVDSNQLQQFGWRDPGSGRRLPPYRGSQLRDRWAAFGWRVLEVDGHDIASVIGVLDQASAVRGAPVVVIAETVKGKGVSFMENDYSWHSRVPTPDELRAALDELADPVAPARDPVQLAPELVGRAAPVTADKRG